MLKRYVEKFIVYLTALVVSTISIKYIFNSNIEKEVTPVILFGFFLIIIGIYIYYMNKHNQKLDTNGVVIKRASYYTHKYSENELEKIYNDLNNKKITKKEFKELVYGDPELSTITVPFDEISNIRKEKNKYFMHIDSLHYEVEITNYKVLKYLQENCK